MEMRRMKKSDGKVVIDVNRKPEEKGLALNISLREKSANDNGREPLSAEYKYQLNDLELGEGVTKTTLIMEAGETPKFIIECEPTDIVIDDVIVKAMFEKKKWSQENDHF